MTWKPIETAPKNGDELLLFREDAGVLLARWTSPIEILSEREIEESRLSEDELNESDWFYADFICGGRLDEPATHWMPLPEPPPSNSTE